MNEPIGFDDRYFDGSEDYPDPTETMIELGWRHNYLSNTFLDGWINYVEPIAAFLMTRYSPHSRNEERLAAFIAAPPFHTKLQQIADDDVHILARDKSGVYWLFEYDCDVSDCAIGRFTTEDTQSNVVAAFSAQAKARGLRTSDAYSGHNGDGDDCTENAGGKAPQAIPLTALRGWMSW